MRYRFTGPARNADPTPHPGQAHPRCEVLLEHLRTKCRGGPGMATHDMKALANENCGSVLADIAE
jgi:hypothetical protein